MEDPAAQQRNDQGIIPDFDIGDYLTNNSDGDSGQLDLFAEIQRHSSTSSQTNTETAIPPQQSILSSRASVEYVSQRQPQTISAAEVLKGRLEQQAKLQQLQQLQNHILQQQIEIISGRSSMNDQHKDIFNGLLTPGPSTELRAMVPRDLVSPMMLQPEMYLNDGPSNAVRNVELNPTSPYRDTPQAVVNQLPSHHHDLSMSAPAALAFQTSPPFHLPSPAEDFDLEPLTSPWLLPVPTMKKKPQQYYDKGASEQSQPSLTRLKRAASISGDDQDGMRKRPSLNTHATNGRAGRTGLSMSPPSSLTTSPVTNAISGLISGKVLPNQDALSPVDLSMPPPAPPISGSHVISRESPSTSGARSTSTSPSLAPVTPASIMNLGKLPTGLAPSHFSTSSLIDASASAPLKRAGKGKIVTKPKVAVPNGVTTRGRRDSATKPGISPNLKPILPGASSTPSTPLLNIHPNSAHASPNFASTPGNSTTGPRKTSHKAAEQKRRDSLKTSFDELRLLLPPVPLPDETGDDPPLPGSMPPRGPPKGDADGPNRGVSKLALLRCGNTYIRDLKSKVGRRDAEIELLRTEVRRLWEMTGEPGGLDVDLERDIDEGQHSTVTVGGYSEDGDDDGE